MTPQQLLTELYRLGVELKPDGDWILYRPQELVPPTLLAEMKQHKPALLGLLREDDDPVVDDTFEPVECPNCGSIDMWFSGLDRPHCMVCDPPSPLAAKFFENARTIRERIEQASELCQPVSRRQIRAGAIKVKGEACPVYGSTSIWTSRPNSIPSRATAGTVGKPWASLDGGEERDIKQ